MSKRFGGIAIAKDLGQDIGVNSSVLENVKGVLYAENINSVIYYNKNLNQLNDGEVPTKKYVAPLISSPTATYGDVQTVKYIDISIGSSKEQQVEDWITIITSGGKYYICNPADSDFIFTYNNQKYFLWKYYSLNGSQASSWTIDEQTHAYFITSIAEYNVLQSCIGNSLSNYVITEFDANKNEVNKVITSETIQNVQHFPGLYFKSIGSTEIGMEHDSGDETNHPNIEYSTNYGLVWSEWNGSTIQLANKQIIWFRGLNPNGFNNYDEEVYVYSNFIIDGSGTIYAYGSIMSLIDQIGELLTIPFNDNSGCFFNLFYGCNKLVKAPALPATSLAVFCYSNMFRNCTALTKAPALPATSLANSCYSSMFQGCTALTEAPVLSSTNLASGCYSSMFQGCTALTEAPALPATSLAGYCYNNMFQDCTALTEAPALPATSLAIGCYSGMFNGCTALAEAPVLSATNLTSSCYSGMFNGCTALAEAPVLSATNLANSCYSGMFRNCTSLIEAPILPATSLADNCYENMFWGCTALTEAPALPATSLATWCYNGMFRNCTSLIEAPTLPATSLSDYCYAYMFYAFERICRFS